MVRFIIIVLGPICELISPRNICYFHNLSLSVSVFMYLFSFYFIFAERDKNLISRTTHKTHSTTFVRHLKCLNECNYLRFVFLNTQKRRKNVIISFILFLKEERERERQTSAHKTKTKNTTNKMDLNNNYLVKTETRSICNGMMLRIVKIDRYF